MTTEQLEELQAEICDLNAKDIEDATRNIEGTARSIGITVGD